MTELVFSLWHGLFVYGILWIDQIISMDWSIIYIYIYIDIYICIYTLYIYIYVYLWICYKKLQVLP